MGNRSPTIVEKAEIDFDVINSYCQLLDQLTLAA